MTMLIGRYIDDHDEFVDRDEALRIRYDHLTKEVRELKSDVNAGLTMKRSIKL